MSSLSLLGRRPVGAKALLLPRYTNIFSYRRARLSRPLSHVANGGVASAESSIRNSHAAEQKESISTFLNAFRPERILVTGALGQVGHELVPALQSAYGGDNVVPTDMRIPTGMNSAKENVNFHRLDVLDSTQLQELCKEEEITLIVHLAAILSANGEKNPLLALKINNEGTQNVLEASRQAISGIKVFIPSTIAVFGTETPKHETPEDCIMRPTTMYGITKVHAELLGEYYHRVFGVDFRSLRYPGVVSTKQMPGGGTTDYAVDIFHEAVQRGKYTCYLEKGTTLPFIYMPDLIQGTIQYLQADPYKLSRRVYNLGSMSFSPKQLAASIRRHLPDFSINYMPDYRQDIADTWPQSVDFLAATNDWGWKPSYDLDDMTRDVLEQFLDEHEEREEAESEEIMVQRDFGGDSSVLSPM